MNDPQIEWSVNHEKRKMEQDILITESKKMKFINEIKNGLGDEIKNEPNKRHKPLKWYQKLLLLFR